MRFRFHPSILLLAKQGTQRNILIDSDGNPLLTDFKGSSITIDNLPVNAPRRNWRGGSIRWCAPELLLLSTNAKHREKHKSIRPTYKSDTYSLAMVGIEVTPPSSPRVQVASIKQKRQIFTRRLPFDLYSDDELILRLWQGMRPEKPLHPQFTSKMWSLTRRCWKKDPRKRPDIPEVLRTLESGSERSTSPFHLISVLAQGAYRNESAWITCGFTENPLQVPNNPPVCQKVGHDPIGSIVYAHHLFRIFCLVHRFPPILENTVRPVSNLGSC